MVEELGLDPGVDTLSRWMAHHIAELIEEVETAKIEERPIKLSKCIDAVLKLWERRHQLPNGKRPFEDFGPVFRALESLDPANDTPRYFPSPRKAANETEQNAETRKWLKLVDYLDYSAKILISYCLTQAAQNALDKSKHWVALSENAGLNSEIDIRVIKFISDESDLTKAMRPNDRARKLLEDRIKRLDEFRKLADVLASDLLYQFKQTEDRDIHK